MKVIIFRLVGVVPELLAFILLLDDEEAMKTVAGIQG